MYFCVTNLIIMKKPIGRPKLNHVQYKRNIKPDFVDKMDKYLYKLKNNEHETKNK